MTAALLDIRHLSVFYGKKAVLQDIDLSLEAGKTTAVIGESGSGKSTLAQCIMGLQPRNAVLGTDSAVSYQGSLLPIRDDRAMRPWRGAKIGMIFQDPMSCLNPYLHVGTQIREAILRDPHREQTIHDRLLALLRMVNFDQPQDIAQRYPHELSGGQQQRIMIAMALAARPQLVIADEPTSSLDARVEEEILELLLQLQQSHHVGMLFITHNMRAARKMSEQVCVLQQGRIVESGPTETIFAHPLHPYTRELLTAKTHWPLLPLAPVPKEHAAPIADLRHVSYSYPAGSVWRRPKQALEDISLAVYPGETLGVIGESGSGKSTLAKLLCGLIQPNHGEIRLFSTDIGHSRHLPLNVRRRCQIVFQNPFGALNPRRTIAQSLYEPLQLLGLAGRNPEKIGEALHCVELSEAVLHRYPHELSGGQRQRVCIARGLLSDPQMLICDEVVSALDPKIQVQVLCTLARLQQQKHFALFFISHDLGVVQRLSSRVAVIYHGHLVECGPTDQVIRQPQHPYTQQLVRASGCCPAAIS